MTMRRQQVAKAFRTLRWTPSVPWQRFTRREWRGNVHLIIAVADHFEPSYVPAVPSRFAPLDEQERRLEEWCFRYPATNEPWRDSDGFPLRHTYFFPAEQYHSSLMERLADHCGSGWGEVEVHLHHGVEKPDTSGNTRRMLESFRDALVEHGCLSRYDGVGPARYAFVHGNFALANSRGGSCCGVDDEVQILAETGCYADLTLPAAPSPAQIGKINALYECALPLDRRAPHRRGIDLRVGRPPSVFPLMIQGPLGLNFARGVVPRIENSEISARNPVTLRRLRLWEQAHITVKGKPEWIFIKLHCHGMDPRDKDAMLGPVRQRFMRELSDFAHASPRHRLHFVTAREMTNIALAAVDGKEGSPGAYRDYRLKLIAPRTGVQWQ
ncbi:MAG TPA: hypothetical protein VFL93_01145 [Longimicrobiaceae bacterium]|nr:hypothetical protein [Longimicrobiaceae bacterium]